MSRKRPRKTFTIVDAAMNDLIRPALYEGYHEIVPLREEPGAANSLIRTSSARFAKAAIFSPRIVKWRR